MDPITIFAIGAATLFLLNKKKATDGAIPYANSPSGVNPDDSGSSYATQNPTTGSPVTETTGAPDAPITAGPGSSRLSERVSTEVYPDAEWLIELLQNAENQGATFEPVKDQINADLISYNNRPVLHEQYQILMGEVNEEEAEYANSYGS